MVNFPDFQSPICAIPLPHKELIVMSHGSGGRMSHDLIHKHFQSHFTYPSLLTGNDFANVGLPQEAHLHGRLAISTDSHIVSPIFFPGGDIGRLAVCGTVNDICMSGAIPLYITAGFILEEGLSIHLLDKIIHSMKMAADEAGVEIIAGDTKVAEKGKVDQVFINTTGIGWIPNGREISGKLAQPGDAVLISGSLGDHGVAVLTARGELGLQTEIKSDVAPLNQIIHSILEVAPHTHVLRDPTRGGVATTLNEIALQSNVGIVLEEDKLVVNPAVRSVCEMLGFDPLYMANEGKLIAIIPENEAAQALEVMRNHPAGKEATQIGTVHPSPEGMVLLRTFLGSNRIVDMLVGEILPRIC